MHKKNIFIGKVDEGFYSKDIFNLGVIGSDSINFEHRDTICYFIGLFTITANMDFDIPLDKIMINFCKINNVAKMAEEFADEENFKQLIILPDKQTDIYGELIKNSDYILIFVDKNYGLEWEIYQKYNTKKDIQIIDVNQEEIIY
jgi:hypothetical protein